jgi:hypothetical protein
MSIRNLQSQPPLHADPIPGQEAQPSTWDRTPSSGENRSNESLLFAEVSLPVEITRLVVLVPDQGGDDANLSRKIWLFATTRHLQVLLLGMVSGPESEYRVARHLTTLIAMTRDNHLEIDTQLVYGHSWVKVLPPLLQPGDMIACPSKPRKVNFIGKRLTLADELTAVLGNPVYPLNRSTIENDPALPEWLRQGIYWLGVIAVLGSFLVLEHSVDQAMIGVTGRLVLIGVVLVELVVLFFWSALLG